MAQQWSTLFPPFRLTRVDDTPTAQPPVTLKDRGGEVRSGNLLALDPELGELELKLDGTSERLLLSQTRYLQFSRPCALRTNGQPLSLEVASFEVDLGQGETLSGRQVASVSDSLGLHLLGEAGGRLYRYWIPRHSQHGYRLGAFGETVVLRSPDAPRRSRDRPDAVLLLRCANELQGYLDDEPIDADQWATPETHPELGWSDRDYGPQLQRARELGYPVAELGQLRPAVDVREILPANLVREFGVVPLAMDTSRIVLAMENPEDGEILRNIGFVTGHRVVPLLAPREQLQRAIHEIWDLHEDQRILAELGLSLHGTPQTERLDAERLASERPIVKLVSNLIEEGLRRRASDIHLRPGEGGFELLYRIDGTLIRARRFATALLMPVVSRLKIIGGMDITERRLPQDGRATWREGRQAVDLRLSVIPTVSGESVVIRLLNTEQSLRDLSEIGFSPKDEVIFRDLLYKSHGMLLVTGPTGSGKSTTLYAALLEARKRNVNLITVEDPVEYHLDGVEQIQVHSGIGFTFARTLRNILRHDPDVIMVGEIRDHETAEIAVESALTGHLLLSTLHTNSAASTVTRLLDLGIESYLLRSTLLGVLAQRLVRRNCPHCRAPELVDEHIRDSLGVADGEEFLRGRGCSRCEDTGYHGRIAVYELMPIGSELRSLIVPRANADEIRRQAIEDGMVPLSQQALELARRHDTSLAEVYGVRVE